MPEFSFANFETGLSLKEAEYASTNGKSRVYGLKAASECKNVVVDETGISRAEGMLAKLTSAIGEPITGLYEYTKTGSGGGKFILVTAGTKIYTQDGSTVTEIYSGITAGARCRFITFNNICLIMNGVDALLQYDGVSVSAVSILDGSPAKWDGAKPRWAEVFRNRLFYTYDDAKPDRVWTPAPGTHNDFDDTTSAFFDVAVGDNGRMVACKALTDGRLVLFKDTSIHLLTGSAPFSDPSDPFSIVEFSREIGCVAPDTIVQVGPDVMFLSETGFKRLAYIAQSGQLNALDPLYQVQPILDTINKAQRGIAFARFVPEKRHVWLHFPTGSSTSNDTILILNVVTGGVMQRTDIVSTIGAITSNIYLTGDANGQIQRQYNSDSLNGAAIAAAWESLWIDAGAINVRKMWRKLAMLTEGSQGLTIKTKFQKVDGSESSSLVSIPETDAKGWDDGDWDVVNFDEGVDALIRKNRVGRGNALKIRLESNVVANAWRVRRVDIMAESRGVVAA